MVRAVSNDEVDEEEEGSAKRGDGRRTLVFALQSPMGKARERGEEDAKGGTGAVEAKDVVGMDGATLLVFRMPAAPLDRARCGRNAMSSCPSIATVLWGGGEGTGGRARLAGDGEVVEPCSNALQRCKKQARFGSECERVEEDVLDGRVSTGAISQTGGHSDEYSLLFAIPVHSAYLPPF